MEGLGSNHGHLAWWVKGGDFSDLPGQHIIIIIIIIIVFIWR
ncbi:hypothetical protein GCM10007928_52670 [Sulfitobacter porphyrae]|nr:hypothetical protein GCM10007928_52670 [Sulfitobacter porphyrae]